VLRRLLALLLTASALGCTKGNECSACRSDSDCKKGLVCSEFNDQQKRCGIGQLPGTSCRVR
jgi:hypothetical protein